MTCRSPARFVRIDKQTSAPMLLRRTLSEGAAGPYDVCLTLPGHRTVAPFFHPPENVATVQYFHFGRRQLTQILNRSDAGHIWKGGGNWNLNIDHAACSPRLSKAALRLRHRLGQAMQSALTRTSE
jgi:hypothetical protein